MEPRNEKDILESIEKNRKEIKKLGNSISKIESWNDESFLYAMNMEINNLKENINLARLFYNHQSKRLKK